MVRDNVNIDVEKKTPLTKTLAFSPKSEFTSCCQQGIHAVER